MIQNEFKKYAIDSKSVIDNTLSIFFDKKIKDAKQYDISYQRLVQSLAKQTLRGGKRLRPILSILGHRMAGGDKNKEIVKAACALEIFHNFLLIHDDIMDRDDYRHGGLNITGHYKKKLKATLKEKTELDHLASSLALLAGDISFGLSSEILMSSGFESDLLISAQQRLNKAVFEVAAGQQLDILSAYKKELSLNKILKIYSYKTADYSVTLPLQFGAILAGTKSDMQSTIQEFGQKVGIAFQLTDDILGMFKNEKELGKPIYSDLREGKQTILMHYGFLLSNAKEKDLLKSYFKNPNIGQKELLKTRKILESNGAKTKTSLLAQQHVDDAIKLIPKITSERDLQIILKEFALFCIKRNK